MNNKPSAIERIMPWVIIIATAILAVAVLQQTTGFLSPGLFANVTPAAESTEEAVEEATEESTPEATVEAEVTEAAEEAEATEAVDAEATEAAEAEATAEATTSP